MSKRKKRRAGKPLINIRGMRFGRLIVLRRQGSYASDKSSRWRCHCDCGRIKLVGSRDLRQGKTKSCGCLRREIARLPLARRHEAFQVTVWCFMAGFSELLVPGLLAKAERQFLQPGTAAGAVPAR